MSDFHQMREKGPSDCLDYILYVVSILWILVVFVGIFGDTAGLFTVPKSFVKSPWFIVPFLGVPVVCGIIALIHKEPDICDRHGCKMEVGTIGNDASFQHCDMCAAELREKRLDAEREVRIEEIAEGYRRATNG